MTSSRITAAVRRDIASRTVPRTPGALRAHVADLLGTEDDDAILDGMAAYDDEIARLTEVNVAEAEIVATIGDTPLGPYMVQAALEKVRRR